MIKVLVTGGCGFIGSHIVEQLLNSKYEVIVVDNLITGNINNIDVKKTSFFQCDISSDEFNVIVSKTMPDYIIHQAAQVSVQESIKDMNYDAEINIKGSLNVIEAAKNYGIKKIVFASSAAVYGEPQYLPIDTSHPVMPLSPYGLSKYTVECYLKLAKEFYGIDYTILRYSNVYGPRQDAKGEGGVISIFSERLSRNEEIIIYGDGKQTRDFVYVEDVAIANVRALEMGSELILNVSTSKQYSLNELIAIMGIYSKSSSEIKFQSTRTGDIMHSVLSNELTAKTLNWTAFHALEIGIKKTMEHLENLVVS